MMALSAPRPPLRALAPIDEVKEVLIHIRFSIVHSYQKKMAISVDPDEMPRFCDVSSGSLLFVNVPFLDIFAYMY